MADTLRFELVSPERLLISDDVRQVEIPGAEGDFTVLPLHAPFLSTLRPGMVAVTMPDGAERHVFVRGGLAEVSGDNLTVLAQQAINLDELDRNWLSEQISNAEEDVADAKDEDTRTAAQNTLDRLNQLRASLPG